MSRDWRLRAEDIRAAADRAIRFVGEMDLAQLKADERTAAAVMYELFVIGEAAARLPEEIRSRASSVPWQQVIGMRNVIAHGYFDLDLEILWKTVHYDLPPLREQMHKLLESERP
jgi:uncharacterized protein with HEPN domain